MTDCLLLAAGYGIRLRPLTLAIPKALLPLHGVPLLGVHVHRLLGSPLPGGRIVINGHHLAAQIETYLSRHPRSDRLRYSFEPEILGTGGALVRAREELASDPFVVMNADALFNPPLAEAIPFHIRGGFLATMILTDQRLHPNVVVQKDRVVRIDRDRCVAGAMTFTGTHIVSQSLVARMADRTAERMADRMADRTADRTADRMAGRTPRREGRAAELAYHDIRDTYDDLAREGRLGAYVVSAAYHPLLDVGSPAAYLEAHRLCGGPQAARYGFDPTLRPPPHPRLEGFGYISDRATVSEPARVADSVILSEATVEPGADIRQCVIASGCVARGSLRRVLLAPGGTATICLAERGSQLPDFP